MLRTAVALGATLTLGALTAAPAAATTGACPDGVTVVVDATALGGEVEIGCATDAATGTEALQQAGFTDVRDAAGMICAIDALPDPCPAEFTGEYWSYWYAADGTWQAYQEGSDTAVPQPGGVEGWRWSDGTAGPEVDLAALVPAADGADGEAAAEDGEDGPTAEATITATQTESQDPAEGLGVPWWVLGAGAAGMVLVALAWVLARRRGTAD